MTHYEPEIGKTKWVCRCAPKFHVAHRVLRPRLRSPFISWGFSKEDFHCSKSRICCICSRVRAAESATKFQPAVYNTTRKLIMHVRFFLIGSKYYDTKTVANVDFQKAPLPMTCLFVLQPRATGEDMDFCCLRAEISSFGDVSIVAFCSVSSDVAIKSSCKERAVSRRPEVLTRRT